ncbi:MAG: hypothetical protein QXX41_00155 [Nitrososphaerota archaeon]
MSWYPGKFVEEILKKRSYEQSAELTLSQIDMTIRAVQGYIEDEREASRMYYQESQNPVIRAVGASELFLELSRNEKEHLDKLEGLLYRLKEKLAEVQHSL